MSCSSWNKCARQDDDFNKLVVLLIARRGIPWMQLLSAIAAVIPAPDLQAVNCELTNVRRKRENNHQETTIVRFLPIGCV